MRGGFPDRERVTLVYVDTVARTCASVTGTDYVFSGNGLFDPDITGTGNQPINFDDWSAIYLRYRCYGSRIEVNCVTGGSATGTGMFQLALAPRHLSTALSTLSSQNSAIGQLYAQSSFYNGGMTTSSAHTLVQRSSITTAKILGYKTSAIDDDDTLQAQTSANPSHQWYWHLMASMVDQSATGTIYYHVKIFYDVEFFDRIETTIDTLVRIPRGLLRQRVDGPKEQEAKAPARSSEALYTPISSPAVVVGDDDYGDVTAVSVPPPIVAPKPGLVRRR